MKKSHTDFVHIFKNHDPLRVFEILMQSLNELNQKRQVRLKWTEPDPKTLTVSFQTKVAVKSTSWGGNHGEARCVASPPNGTELQLVLVPAASRAFASLSGSMDGHTVLSRRGYDIGEREAIWNSIIKEVQSQLSRHSLPTPPPPTTTEDMAEDRQPPAAQVPKGAADDSKESTAIEVGSLRPGTATAPGPATEHQHHSAENLRETGPADMAVTSLPLGERLDLLERLGSLKERGHLSPAEFSEQKTRLIYG